MPGDGITEADFVFVDQFSDAKFSHPLNDSRTASVTLSMHNPIVENLTPYGQAAAVFYVAPGMDPEDGEKIIWGQCNVTDDYGAGTVTLDIQDPAIRLQHHYLRVGDVALNDPKYEWRGNVTQDGRGVWDLLQGGYMNVSAPLLGLAMKDQMASRTLLKGVERSQEIWQTILDLTGLSGGTDFDIKPTHNFTGGLDDAAVSGEDLCYATLCTYNPPFSASPPRLMRDLTSSVIFEYGGGEDNVSALTVTPLHPTTDVILVDSVQSIRTRGIAVTQRAATGDWQDWISLDEDMSKTLWTVPEEKATEHLRAYARPLAQIDLTLRPDVGVGLYYGDPDKPFGPYGDFYIGDRVTVRATRGLRSFADDYRIVQVDMEMNATRGPIQTNLTLSPLQSDITPVVETEYTTGTRQH